MRSEYFILRTKKIQRYKISSMDYLQNLSPPPHFVLFPFMAKGHIIPMLHLARLLLRRGVTITIFTTPLNSPFISQSLFGTTDNDYKKKQVTIIDLPFPKNVPELPDGIESTDKLPSISLFFPFALATKLMKPHFDEALNTLSSSKPVSCIISDGFLFWTLDSAAKLGVPRFVYYGMSNYATAFIKLAIHDRLEVNVKSDDEPFTVAPFPWIKLTRNDFEPPLNEATPKGAFYDFLIDVTTATTNSKGVLVNSFYELEPVMSDYVNKEWEPKSWCVGPLCLSEPPPLPPTEGKSKWVQWLDEKLAKGKFVLYVAFGTQAELTSEQLRELAAGLERSQVNFLWVLRQQNSSGTVFLEEGFEERVKERGVVVRDWVNQVEVLRHESVKGFISHCGWNSTMESICAGVPLLAWPVLAEQHLNARMVVDELGIGVRVLGENGSVRGFVRCEMVEKMVKELMEGESGKKARKKVKELQELGRRAMEEGGSSWKTLNDFIQEICVQRNKENN